MELATCETALPPAGDAPEWVHLFPAGRIEARDGRVFSLPDPQAVVLAFQGGNIDLPIDYEHQNDTPAARLKGPVPAAGWIKELAHNESGIWGRVEWTAIARDMIKRKEYRFLSPAFLHNKSGQIMRLKGAGLVHAPAFHLTALASQEAPMLDKTKSPAQNTGTSPRSKLMDRLLKVLNLGPDATEEEALDALEAWLDGKANTPDPAKYVPAEAVAEMLRSQSLQTATATEQQVIAKVDSAVRSGRLPPALKDWALALCRTDVASFETFLEGSAPAYAHLSTAMIAGNPPASPRAPELTGAEAAVCAQLGLKPEQLAAD